MNDDVEYNDSLCDRISDDMHTEIIFPHVIHHFNQQKYCGSERPTHG